MSSSAAGSPPRTVLVAVAQEDRTEEGAPGTATSLRELERPAGTDGLTVVETLVQSRGPARIGAGS